MKYVLLYESADDVATKAPQQFPAHLERIKEFQSRGEILMVGTFGDPQREGAMGVFPTRESVEAFREARLRQFVPLLAFRAARRRVLLEEKPVASN